MSLPSSLLRLWAARLASKIALCTAISYDLYQLSKAKGKDGSMKLAIREDSRRQLKRNAKKETRSIEDVFISSLVAAGTCRHHAMRRGGENTKRIREHKHPLRFPTLPRYTLERHFSSHARRHQSAAAAAAAAAEPVEITAEEYKELVNTYESLSDIGIQLEHKVQQYPLAPRLVLPPEKEDQPPHAPREVLPPESEEHAAALQRIYALLERQPGRLSLVRFWEAFQSLQAPRLRYIPDDDIRKAFRHLSWVEFKDSTSMSRYFALLNECIGEQIPVTLEEWNTAVAFAGQWLRTTTVQEVKSAVETWLRMERQGVAADHITFNILFHVAVKAGRFALADAIFAELKAREMPLDRYFRASYIYYQGMRGDGDGVRQAFRDFVNAGELVDTTIMNAVILSLVRSGEPSAAEDVFGRMKRLVEQKLGTGALHSWQQHRELGKKLSTAGAKFRTARRRHERSFFGSPFSMEGRKEEEQRMTPIGPNARTYRILIQHHCYGSGDYRRANQLLEEMRERGLSVHGSVYKYLLYGFWLHGGYGAVDWHWKRLETVWADFLRVATDGRPSVPATAYDEYEVEQAETDRAPYFTRALAHSALRAFYKCVGRKRMVELWEQIKDRWKAMPDDDREILQSLVDKLVHEDSMFE